MAHETVVKGRAAVIFYLARNYASDNSFDAVNGVDKKVSEDLSEYIFDLLGGVVSLYPILNDRTLVRFEVRPDSELNKRSGITDKERKSFEKFREGFLKYLVQLDLASPSGLETSEK